MKLYARDYRKLTASEIQEYQRILDTEKRPAMFGKACRYNEYPEAVKHYLSLFPNNHINLFEMKKRDIHSINMQFQELIHDTDVNEQTILRFINHEPQAYHIVASIFEAGGFTFGHHDAYLFPEFKLGKDYRADYLLIGKSSGGYEFIFIEFEKSNGRVALKDGHLGQVIRDGENQITDWKKWIDSYFHTLKEFFDAEKNPNLELPQEFYNLDSTRMHYVVVGGTREDYKDKTYELRRRKLKDSDIRMLHYDNLFDSSELLLQLNTF